MLSGHAAQIAEFRAAMAGPRPHQGWLLTGPKGIGKAMCARLAAARLLAEASGTPPSGGFEIDSQHPTARLLLAGSHPDFKHLSRLTNDKTGALARNITVDQVRALRALFVTAPSMGNRRVILVDSIDDMERSAANALLKSLEEPPASTIFLLVSHAPGRLLPTIRSRCRTLVFRPLTDALVEDVLAECRPDLAPERRTALAANAGGIPAAALAAADLDMDAIERALVTLAQTGDPSNATRAALAQSLALKAALPRYHAFLDYVPRFLAQAARAADGAHLERALDAWESAQKLGGSAVSQSLIAETVVFEMAGYVTMLAPQAGAAKA